MDKFVTPCQLPTDYEREVLTILIEECAEVQQRATKLLRFGRDEVQPGQEFTNAERLSHELGDLAATVDLATDAKLIIMRLVNAAADRKLIKLRKYMQTEKPTCPS